MWQFNKVRRFSLVLAYLTAVPALAPEGFMKHRVRYGVWAPTPSNRTILVYDSCGFLAYVQHTDYELINLPSCSFDGLQVCAIYTLLLLVAFFHITKHERSMNITTKSPRCSSTARPKAHCSHLW